ncbi:EAL domain-containing protein [Acidovorax sp. Leaf160]|uniref:EAL domain-containing protein n=1 Tax=Acidovorax sp. Leaf160 TaxID=1736280 RepID=UPI0009E7951A|nr:EAL domain-containing protein [Acidovorax sp. Leaf160]
MSQACFSSSSRSILQEENSLVRKPGSVIVYIANLDMLVLAYGVPVKDPLHGNVVERLRACGFAAHSLSGNAAVFLIDLPASGASQVALDRLLERLRAAIEDRPFTCAGHRIYLQAGLDVFYLPDGSAATDVQEAFAAHRGWAPGGEQPYAAAVTGSSLRSDLLQAGMLLDALQEGALALAFQSVLRTDGAVLYHEALLRHAAPGTQDVFNLTQSIRALERTGGAARLEQCVVWTCVQLLRTHPDQRLGCNVSAMSLRDTAWWRLLLDHLAHHPQVAGRLVLEIKETSGVPASAETFELLARLQGCGARIAIDDMGAGHSTLEFLARSQADVVKMDRNLVVHALHSPAPADMLRKLVAACSVLCPCVVVEDIETPAEFAAVRQSGARGLQGVQIQVPELKPAWLKSGQAIVACDATAAVAPTPADGAARPAGRAGLPPLAA